MNILDTAIETEGGISALARKLDIKPNVISNWMTRGTPKGWERVLSITYKKQAKARAQRAEIATNSIAA